MIELVHGDCLEIMKEIPDNFIDMVYCDMPYGITACKWDSVLPLPELWEQYDRICKDSAAIVLNSSQPFTTTLISSNMKWFKYCWIWNKKKGGNIQSLKYQPYKIHEDICIFSNGTHLYKPIKTAQKTRTGKTYSEGEANGIKNYGDLRTYKDLHPKSIIEFSNANQKGKEHPTQKPIELIEYLVKTYSNENDIVLDNCMGSGTTGAACKNLNRDFIGIEKEKNYFDIAKRRIENKS